VLTVLMIMITQNDLFKDSGKGVPSDAVPLSGSESKALSECASKGTGCKHLKPAQVATVKKLLSTIKAEHAELKKARAALKKSPKDKKVQERVRKLRSQ